MRRNPFLVLLFSVAMVAASGCGGSSHDEAGTDLGGDGVADVLLADVTFEVGPASDVAAGDGTGDTPGASDAPVGDGAPDAAPGEPAPETITDGSPTDPGADPGPDVVAPCVAFDTVACASVGALGGTCLPDGTGHLACLAAGEAPEGAACVAGSVAPSEACAPGLACVAPSTGLGAGGACATPCHRAEPDCPEGAWCRGTFPDAPVLGTCFQRACTPFEPGSCGAPDLSCLPTADGGGSCQPAGTKTDGQACGTGVGLCVEGLTCLLEGPAGGRCVPFCDPVASPGAPAACPGQGATCVDIGVLHFGLCLAACDPWASDPSGVACASPQACVPVGDGVGACFTAGSALPGEPCAKAGAWWACAPGAQCVAPVTEGQPVCERTCRPFGPASDCPETGTFCALRKTWLGTCEAGALGLGADAPCGPSGAWCGPNVRCLDLGLGQGPTCVQYCRVGAADCPAGRSCLQTYGVDVALGICW